jgi:hypothetical protein
MNGDFKGDFTRDTFDLFKGFSRVLMQQGRVQLDADWNEQHDILLRLLRQLARDVIGRQGTPYESPGFVIDKDSSDAGNFSIGPGEYYVDGILTENKQVDDDGEPIPVSYKNQPYQPRVDDLTKQNLFFVYLDVWERQVSFIEDDGIREVALGVTGPDTATRGQVVWQVKVLTQADLKAVDKKLSDTGAQFARAKDTDKLQQLISEITSQFKGIPRLSDPGRLRARAKLKAPEDTNVCITPPDAQYRGAENQLYRVEIHNSGPAWPGTGGARPASEGGTLKGATFKWSRDDASVTFSIIDINDNVVTLAGLGRDDRSTLQAGDWVEAVDDASIFQVFGDPGSQPYPSNPLLRVNFVDRTTMEVTLSGKPKFPDDPPQHPLLRRWDQKARVARKGEPPDLFDKDTGTVKVVEIQGQSEDETDWITLEDGVQIQFQSQDPKTPAVYRPGDYWLIPARVITGDVEWPQKKDGTHKFLTPHGVEHHLALLAGVTRSAEVINITNAQTTFKTLVHLTHP